MVFAIDRAGIIGEDGETHQGIFDYSYLSHIPNIIVMAPKDENEMRHMLNTAVMTDAPIAIRYPRGGGLGVPTDERLCNYEIGKSEELKDGRDVVFFAAGAMVAPCLEASEILAGQRLDVGVVNARFIKPLDGEAIAKMIGKEALIVTVEDNTLSGGFGSSVLEYIYDRGWYNAKLLRLGLPDRFIEHGTRDELLTKYHLDGEGIAAAVANHLNAKRITK